MVIKITDNFETREGTNWSVNVVLSPETQEVEIYEFFGNGSPMAVVNGTAILLAWSRSANYANVDELVSYLESDEGQEMLKTICQEHSISWNGSNHVGKLTLLGEAFLEEICQTINYLFEQLPHFWPADEWFASVSDEEILSMLEEAGSVSEAAKAAVAQAYPEELDEENVFEYFEKSLELLEREGDFEVANRARAILGKPPLTEEEYYEPV